MGAPVIIEAAINGVMPKATNPSVPRASGEIAGDAIRCLGAGAAIVHSHNAEFAVDSARASALYLDSWRPVLAARPDAILYPTLGFGDTVAERFGHHLILAKENAIRMAVFDPGSVNLGSADHDGWPVGDLVYRNSYDDVRHVTGECARLRLGPSVSVFEPGFLRTALALHRAARLPAGAFVKLYFGGDHDFVGRPNRGVTFGLPPTRKALDTYLEMLEGTDLPWAVAAVGGDVVGCGLARLALERGGHVRVGLEDYGGDRRPTNEELVREVAALARECGRTPASPAEAAQVLHLPDRG